MLSTLLTQFRLFTEKTSSMNFFTMVICCDSDSQTMLKKLASWITMAKKNLMAVQLCRASITSETVPASDPSLGDTDGLGLNRVITCLQLDIGLPLIGG